MAVMLAGTLFMSNCAESTGTDDTNPLSGLDSRVVETVLENDESGDVVTASDVVIDRVFYGSFSKPETEEALVVCRILNTPHAGGLDRIIISAQSTYQGISTQNVMYFCIENGQWAETPVEELGLFGESGFR